MEEPDLLSIGEHCQEPSCRQKDFLPFKCDCCGKTYCLEHRTYGAHACPKANGRTDDTVICPLCARLIKIAAGEDPNAVFERHVRGDCEPSNYARVNKKARCPVPGCRERLNLVNTHVCKHCSVSVCLKHRFADDHDCQHRKSADTQRVSANSILSNLLSFAGTPPTQSKGTSLASSSSSTVRDTAKRIYQDAQNSVSSIVRGQVAGQGSVQGQGVRMGAKGNGEEVCPICSKTFSCVSQLIAHGREHELEANNPELCPHCQATFPNAVLLVEHVERHHTDHKGCVVC